jgi:biotin carboxyl carrier protein
MELVMLSSAGAEMRVGVERSGSGFVVEVDGVRYEVDRARSGSLLRSLVIEGAQREVSVQRLGHGRYRVTGYGVDDTFEVRDPLAHLSHSAAARDVLQGGQTVEAYMPGRVVTLLLSEGESVEVGQGVVVLEAMKMENEIQAQVAGVVKKIFVEEGQSVEGGDPLFEIESA